MIPNVQTAWETFVMTKCSEVCQASFRLYKETMKAELSGKLPCDNDVIRQKHEMALQKGLAPFDKETFGIAATTTKKYRKEMRVREKKVVFQEKKIAILISRKMIRTALITHNTPFNECLEKKTLVTVLKTIVSRETPLCYSQ